MRDWLIGLGLLSALLWVIDMAVGWLMVEIIVSAVLAGLLIRALFLKDTSRSPADWAILLLCAPLCLANTVLPAALGVSRHQLLLFLLMIVAVVFSFGLLGELVSILRGRSNRTSGLSRRMRVLFLVPIFLGYCCLAWGDYRWFPVLVKVSRWEAKSDDVQFPPRGPVLVVSRDLHPKGSLQREVGIGRLPRVSDLYGNSRMAGVMPFASTPDEVRSVILLVYDYANVGSYLDKGGNAFGGAYEGLCRIFLLDLVSRQRMSLGTVSGSSPSSRSATGYEYGDRPDEDTLVQTIIDRWRDKTDNASSS
jgi:hypothetical protein